MHFSTTTASVLLLSSAAMASNATVHVVQVGLNSSLTFSPSNIQAKAGEIIQFQFLTKNHSVVQSTFASPCDAIDTATTNLTGFSSGFMPVNNSIPVFSVTVNNTQPIYAHCSQTGHCAKGMVFSVNAPTNGSQTFKAFQSLALASANTTTNAASNSTANAASSASNAAVAASSSAAIAAASSATTSAPATAKGTRSFVDMALVMLLAVFGVFYLGL